ncbi:MAG: tetratricopeptide repeat protein, partial [Candidatus Omnitrophica bacterium]|nr:tetratricopeptide repeat protein [Candidatus Omnitrophota bacterium]
MFSKSSLKFLALLAFLLIAFNGVTFAEDIENEVQRMRRETRAEKQSAKAAEGAKAVAFREQYKTGVTFQDILKDPDNVDLNIQYAKGQIARNEYQDAAATLERVLLVSPNLADVRALYLAVLYRLSNWDGAVKEIKVLRGMTLTPKIRSEVDFYDRNIKVKKKRTRFNLRESVGWGYDTNRNAAPHSKSQLVGDIMTA